MGKSAFEEWLGPNHHDYYDEFTARRAWNAAIDEAVASAKAWTPEKFGGAPLASHCTGVSIEKAITALKTEGDPGNG